jgi:hypothetical protein
MNWYSIAGDLIFFSPIILLPLGWARWVRTSSSPRGWRQRLVALGMVCASISCVCSFGVVLYLRVVRIGYWSEYLVASRWGRLNLPLSVAAIILGAFGKGTSRVLLLLTACGLLAVWTDAFIH